MPVTSFPTPGSQPGGKALDSIYDFVIGLARSLRLAMIGKLNNVGTATLTANVTTTTLTDLRIGPNSMIAFMATTANAKTEGEPWVSARSNGSCTLNHASAATTDRTFDYTITG